MESKDRKLFNIAFSSRPLFPEDIMDVLLSLCNNPSSDNIKMALSIAKRLPENNWYYLNRRQSVE